jgi:hypothetical protein
MSLGGIPCLRWTGRCGKLELRAKLRTPDVSSLMNLSVTVPSRVTPLPQARRHRRVCRHDHHSDGRSLNSGSGNQRRNS